LKKRVCEHCRYFEPAGIPKTGWCSHPQRKQSSDLLLMVRANELPCRNSWAHDLFVAADEPEAKSDVVAFDDVVVEPRERPLFDESDPRIAATAPGPDEKGSGPSSPEDIVVGEGPSMMGPPNRPSLIELQPRNAILKAREQYRARLAAESRGDDVAPLPPTSDMPVPQEPSSGFRLTPLDTWTHVPPTESRVRMPIRNEVPPVQTSELRNDFPELVTKPSDEAVYSSVPQPVPGIVLPRLRQSEHSQPIGVAGAHDVPDHEIFPEPSFERGAEQPADFTITALQPVEERAESVPAVEEEAQDYIAFDPAVDEGDTQWLPYPPRRTRRPLFGRKRRLFIQDQQEQARAYEEIAPAYEMPAYEVDEPILEPLPEPPARRPRDTRRDDIAAIAETPSRQVAVRVPESVMLPDVVALNNDEFDEPMPVVMRDPSIPRICETCRDFRPGEKQGRGRCMNSRAFAETTVVSPSVLACSSSFGDWWSRADSFWLNDADISLHGQPTPLVDAWLARKVESATEKSGGQRTERRRKQS
jgi:hypothetical protein